VLYATLELPFGTVLVVQLTVAALIVMEKLLSVNLPPLLVAVIVKLLVVAVATGENPEIDPVEEFNDAPLGRFPDVIEYDTVLAPGPGDA
jgi:hypothetical protein